LQAQCVATLASSFFKFFFGVQLASSFFKLFSKYVVHQFNPLLNRDVVRDHHGPIFHCDVVLDLEVDFPF
jgi:hypothetical protein